MASLTRRQMSRCCGGGGRGFEVGANGDERCTLSTGKAARSGSSSTVWTTLGGSPATWLRPGQAIQRSSGRGTSNNTGFEMYPVGARWRYVAADGSVGEVWLLRREESCDCWMYSFRYADDS